MSNRCQSGVTMVWCPLPQSWRKLHQRSHSRRLSGWIQVLGVSADRIAQRHGVGIYEGHEWPGRTEIIGHGWIWWQGDGDRVCARMRLLGTGGVETVGVQESGHDQLYKWEGLPWQRKVGRNVHSSVWKKCILRQQWLLVSRWEQRRYIQMTYRAHMRLYV